MVSHKSGGSHNGSAGYAASPANTASQLALGYVRDFSAQAARYNVHKTEESLALLNRAASLCHTAVQPAHFDPHRLEMAKFFVDLHTVVGSLSAESDAMWSCIAVLQQSSRNADARRAIVAEYRFLPVLTVVLRGTRALDKVERLLTLLQDLTYGIRITWEEPYVGALLEQLVDIVYEASSDEKTNELHVQLALTVLINLCYKNFAVLFLFLRSVNMSRFAGRIQKFGMLANKLLIILSEDMHTPNEREMSTFLRSTFAAVDECLTDWNVPHLRHIVDFLLDSRAHQVLHETMVHYDKYCEDIEKLLDKLASRCAMEDSSDDTVHQQHICMGLIFRLIGYILQLGSLPVADGSENVISLDAIVPRIFEVLCNWLESDVCGVEATDLLDALLRLTKKDVIAPRIARDPSIVVHLIATSEKPETSDHHCAAILQLLLTLLHQPKTEKLILTKITESYFDKLLAPLVAQTEMELQHIGAEAVEKPVFVLSLLINFAGIAKKAYLDKCCTLLRLPQVQRAVATAMLSGCERVCRAVFAITQFEHFPQDEVAKHLSSLNSTMGFRSGSPVPSQDSSQQWRQLNAAFKSSSSFASKAEERLNAVIEVVTTAHRNQQLHNVATSQIIELFNYKIDKYACTESSLTQRLEDASKQITVLTQRINLQNAELQKYHTMNFELHIQQESLQAQCKDLKQQKDNLKTTMADLINKLTEKSEMHQINEKRLNVKTAELMGLQNQFKEQQEQLRLKTEEYERLLQTSKENSVRIEKLKKSIGAFESDIKEKVHIIEERDRDLTRTLKALEEQKEAKKKADDVINVLEAQLQKKSEELRNCEMELSETEEMRKTIMCLMESKKPKRKM